MSFERGRFRNTMVPGKVHRAHREHPYTHDPSATAAFAAISADTSKKYLERENSANIKRAVVIGGGTGAPMSIRSLLSLGLETSAVVAMADDGGSTGILRAEADATAPGDVRKCIAAFAADPTDPLTRAFKYRFTFAQNHTLGNLMLAALEDAAGSFPEAISICERLLNARGHVYPSTLDSVNLAARTRDGRILEGQACACKSKTALERVWLTSAAEPRPFEGALQAIRCADLIVLGPGSLFTSIIPNLLVPGIIEACRESSARVLFVCSVADVQGETWGLTAREHLDVLYDHGMYGLIDYMLVHTPSFSGTTRPVSISHQDVVAIQNTGPVVIARNLADATCPTWHNASALRDAFAAVIKMCSAR